MSCHLDHPRMMMPSRRAAFKALCAMSALLVLSDASASAADSSSFDGMLNSYRAYRAYMKGDSGSGGGGARRRMLLDDVGAEEEEERHASSSSSSSSSSNRVLPSSPQSRSIVGAVVGGPSSSNNNRGGRRSRREQLKLSTEEEGSGSSSTTMCSCSPMVFHLKFDFSQNCSDDDIKSNDGIRGTLCLLGEAPEDIDVGVTVVPDHLPGGNDDVSEAPTYLVDDTLAPSIPASPAIAPSPVVSAPPVVADDIITNIPTSSTSTPPVTAPPVTDDITNIPTSSTTTMGIATYFPTYAPTGVGADPFAPPGAGAAVIESVLEDGDGDGDDAPVEEEEDGGVTTTAPAVSKREHHRMKEDEKMRANAAAIASPPPPPPPTPHLASSDATPYPTDDETYPPTFVVAEYDGGGQWKFPSSWAATTTSGGGVGGGGSGGRLLANVGGSSFGRWMSVHPNDEFFVRFPELKAGQEEIYRLRSSGGGGGTVGTIVSGHLDRRNSKVDRRRDLQGSEGMTIAEIAAANSDFSILLAAATAAGFQDILTGEEPMTIFAPTNAAFEALPEDMLDMLLLPENIGLLQDVLKYHIMSGAILSVDFVTGEYPTLQGSDVTVEVSETGMKVEYAEVLYPDIAASNGVVHVIDAVLLPPVATDVSTTEATEVPGDDVSVTVVPTPFEVPVDDVESSTLPPSPPPSPAADPGPVVVVDPGSIERLVSAQFLEMDTSPDMNIINQDDQYIVIPHDPSDSKDITLSYTSTSASLDPAVPLDDQLDLLPGGVILILIGQTNNGEIVRNRVMWTYTMGCGKKDVTIEAGEGLGWTIFDELEPARAEFCPAITTEMSKPSGTSSKSGKPHKPTASSSDSSSVSDFSMPHGELLDNFDLDESKASGKKGKSRRRRMERNHQLDRNRQQRSASQQVEDGVAEEMANNIFGRRLSRYNEATRIKSSATESGKPLKRRLRTRSA